MTEKSLDWTMKNQNQADQIFCYNNGNEHMLEIKLNRMKINIYIKYTNISVLYAAVTVRFVQLIQIWQCHHRIKT